MKLNKQGRNELRAKIEEQLKDVPEGQRIHLDKNILDELLFEKVSGEKFFVKIPVWSGIFLSKIDLSEISFEDVSWNIDKDGKDYTFLMSLWLGKEETRRFMEIINPIIDEMETRKKDSYFVNYSYTNAKIDFLKSYEHKTRKYGAICNVDFSGTDLSHSNFEIVNACYNVNFSDTNINVTKLSLDDNRQKIFFNCNLENIDLSKISVSLIDEKTVIYNNNLKNTGLNINYHHKETYDYYNTTKNIEFLVKQEIQEIDKGLRDALNNGTLDGCYLNGKLIKAKDERKQIAQQKKEEYENFKKDIFSSVNTSIDEQVINMKKNKR